MVNSQFPKNAKKPMNNPLAQDPTPAQQEAQGRLANLFGGSKRQAPYTPILKALETIDIDQRIEDHMIGDEAVECLIIPLQELIFKEWRHTTQSTIQPQNERKENVK